MTDTVTVNSHTIELSNLDKILFPDEELTKGELIDYYQRMAPMMLPHLADRPLTMHRFPNGINNEGFYQKEAPPYFPDWIRRVSVEVKEEGQSQEQVICDDVATLVYLANQACITPTSGSAGLTSWTIPIKSSLIWIRRTTTSSWCASPPGPCATCYKRWAWFPL